MHLAVVGLLLRSETDTRVRRAYFSKFLELDDNHPDNPLVHLHSRSVQLLAASMVFGVALVFLNIFTDNFFTDSQFGEHSCVDPLINTTIANVKPNAVYQWVWVLFSIGMLILVGKLTDGLRRDELILRAQRVHHMLCRVASQTLVRRTMKQWQEGAISGRKEWHVYEHGIPVKLHRRIAFYMLHLPLLLCSGLPAWGYVLSIK